MKKTPRISPLKMGKKKFQELRRKTVRKFFLRMIVLPTLGELVTQGTVCALHAIFFSFCHAFTHS